MVKDTDQPPGIAILQDHLGFSVPSRLPGSLVRCVVLSYGNGSFESMRLRVHIIPSGRHRLPGFGRRTRHHVVKWWKFPSVENAIVLLTMKEARDLEKQFSFLMDGMGNKVGRK
ncbi:MAG: hypothetical protein AB199_02200 [Parcubacteria bacterium C7867-004]|nr:MAG: hypothetical protein AB199_02200 [Parcubacteria bacterium C7867-004]